MASRIHVLLLGVTCLLSAPQHSLLLGAGFVTGFLPPRYPLGVTGVLQSYLASLPPLFFLYSACVFWGCWVCYDVAWCKELWLEFQIRMITFVMKSHWPDDRECKCKLSAWKREMDCWKASAFSLFNVKFSTAEITSQQPRIPIACKEPGSSACIFSCVYIRRWLPNFFEGSYSFGCSQAGYLIFFS